MANFDFSISTTFMPAITTAETFSDGAFLPTTATPLITPTFSSLNRNNQPYVPNELGLILGMTTRSSSYSTPKRPSGGQLYPRGNQ
jgi:hypothetical protein